MRLLHPARLCRALAASCAIGCFGILPTVAAADIFVDVNTISGNGNVIITGVAAPDPSDVDNDNVAGVSPNTVGIDLTVNALNQNDLVFTPFFTAGTTEYTSTVTLFNNTGVAWSSFSLEIGEGGFNGTTDTFSLHAANDATFTNFDYPDEDSPFTSPDFATVSVASNRIVYSDGFVDVGGSTTFQFQVDVPTNQPFVTFRGTVTAVPEPSTFAAMSAATGLIGIGFWRKRRRSKKPSRVC